MDILALGDTEMNIFVGNLAFTTTEQDLRHLFEPYGTVDTIRIMTDRDTGRSRVLASSRCQTATRHRTRLPNPQNGTSLAGRPLTVNEARPRGTAP